MKIFFVSGSLNRGGAQRVMTLLADDSLRHGWETHIAVLLENQIGYSIDSQIIVHDFVRRGNQIKNLPKWICDLRKTFKAEKPDVIVAFAGRINMITMLAALGLGIPVLVSERNDPAHDRRSKPEKWLSKCFYAMADRVVFQTAYQQQYYRRFCRKNSIIIGNPIAAPVYDGPHPEKNIICVGKLMDQKNHPMMIRAFKQVADAFPEKQVFIYGEGGRREELTRLIEASGLSGRVHLCGNTTQIFDVMHTQEYFVMCSSYEGLSNALLEAMISGMVCITTNWNGVEELVQDGVNGYLVPIGDADALAAKLRSVLNRDHAQIRQAAIETGKRFSGDSVLAQWRQAIESIIRA